MQTASVNRRVHAIKNDKEAINRFVDEYKPFIASCVEKATGRYVRYGEDDELSIAMMAFVEAIQAYDEKKGNFIPFAGSVIQRRLVDYYRKEKKHGQVISLYEYAGEEEEDERDLSAEQSLRSYADSQAAEYRRLEIQQLQKELAEWDISFTDLAKASPKHQRTKKAYAQIVQWVLANPDVMVSIRTKKYLPIADIEKHTELPRKKIERARKYIIAAVVIASGDYQYIGEYMRWG